MPAVEQFLSISGYAEKMRLQFAECVEFTETTAALGGVKEPSGWVDNAVDSKEMCTTTASTREANATKHARMRNSTAICIYIYMINTWLQVAR